MFAGASTSNQPFGIFIAQDQPNNVKNLCVLCSKYRTYFISVVYVIGCTRFISKWVLLPIKLVFRVSSYVCPITMVSELSSKWVAYKVDMRSGWPAK